MLIAELAINKTNRKKEQGKGEREVIGITLIKTYHRKKRKNRKKQKQQISKKIWQKSRKRIEYVLRWGRISKKIEINILFFSQL